MSNTLRTVRCRSCGSKRIVVSDGRLVPHPIHNSRWKWLRIDGACVASGRLIDY